MLKRIRSSFKQPNSAGLVLNIGFALLLACLANLLVFALHLDRDNKDEIKFPVPGYVIGIVWLLLFALMGLAKWVLNFRDNARTKKADSWITILMTSCAAWVFLLAAKNIYVGLAGNFAIILLSIITMGYCLKISKAAGFFIFPVFVWVSFATATLIVLIYRR